MPLVANNIFFMSSDASDDFEARFSLLGKPSAHFPQVLDACHLVASRPIVLADLCFDHDLRVELAGDDEIWCLIESGNALGTLGLAEADPNSRKDLLDNELQTVTDQVADRVTVSRKKSSQKTFVNQYSIRDANLCEVLDATMTVSGVCLVEAMNPAGGYLRHSLL